ncbi:hypothetical protein pah_c050o036 [Parachlamydia acanthamoebae str. Hall's coccus]|nr:hypothetical protein pah_c050o036 [Parachlamydia acanthamoebae str. Hall's coccus]
MTFHISALFKLKNGIHYATTLLALLPFPYIFGMWMVPHGFR